MSYCVVIMPAGSLVGPFETKAAAQEWANEQDFWLTKDQWYVISTVIEPKQLERQFTRTIA